MPPEPPSSPTPQPAGSAPKSPPAVDLLQALLENTPNAVYFKDRDSRFLMVSRSLARLLGLADPQEAFGKCDHDFFSAEHADQARADELRIMDTGEPLLEQIEKETWPDGRVTWASSTKLPLRDAAGRIVGTFGISRDVTAHMVAEQRLLEAKRDLGQGATRPGLALLAAGLFSEALGLVEQTQIKAERLRRRAAHTTIEAGGQLAQQLAVSAAPQELAVEIGRLLTRAAADQKALVEEIGELQQSLKTLARLLEMPR